MPVLVAPDSPSSAPTVNFLISPLYDMLISLSTLAHPGERHEGWVAEVKRDLSPAMREEADYFSLSLREPPGRAGGGLSRPFRHGGFLPLP